MRMKMLKFIETKTCIFLCLTVLISCSKGDNDGPGGLGSGTIFFQTTSDLKTIRPDGSNEKELHHDADGENGYSVTLDQQAFVTFESTLYDDGWVYIRNLGNNQIIQQIAWSNIGNAGEFRRFEDQPSISPNGNWVIARAGWPIIEEYVNIVSRSSGTSVYWYDSDSMPAYAWTPASDLVYARGASNNWQIRLVSASGIAVNQQSPTTLATLSGTNPPEHFNVSADGKHLAFIQNGRLFTMPLTEQAQARQVAHAGHDLRYPVFSPDGARIALVRHEFSGGYLGGEGWGTLHIVPAHGEASVDVLPEGRYMVRKPGGQEGIIAKRILAWASK